MLKRLIATLATVALIILTSTATFAGPMPEADYRAAMTNLDEIETLIISSIVDLQSGMTRTEAQARLPHLQERLQWMRDIKVTAGRYDTTTTLREISDEHKYAHCIIMRSGLMDDTFQDVWANVSMKASGASDEKLLPVNKDAFTALNTRRAC